MISIDLVRDSLACVRLHAPMEPSWLDTPLSRVSDHIAAHRCFALYAPVLEPSLVVPLPHIQISTRLYRTGNQLIDHDYFGSD